MKTALIALLLALTLQAQQEPCIPSAELQQIYDADQADRETPSPIDWDVVRPRDEARRGRVAEILDADAEALCPVDLHNAAMVFQHGGEAPQYLIAHILACAAAVRGHEPSRWLSAASLDRYLKAIGQPQVFGTQYNKLADEPWTQEPFDRTFLSQALRNLFKVPDLTEQQSRLDGLNNAQP